jgi:hypothetical protein
MRDELAFNRKTNYVSGFYRVKNIRFVPCRSMYVQEENYKCYKQQGLTTYSAMRVELTFNRKTMCQGFIVRRISALCHAGQCISRKIIINVTSNGV